jgi:hypothetical protein
MDVVDRMMMDLEEMKQELQAMEVRAEEQRCRAEVSETWNEILEKRIDAAEKERDDCKRRAEEQAERAECNERRITRLHEELNASELGKLADELDEDNQARAAGMVRCAAIKIAKLQAVADAARIWSDAVEAGFAAQVRPDIARAKLNRALATLDEKETKQ